jgi:hypothetical protein
MQSKYQRKRDPSEKKAPEQEANTSSTQDKNLYKDIEKSKEE